MPLATPVEKVYRLKYPLVFKNGDGTTEHVEEITLRAPQVKHMKGIDLDRLDTKTLGEIMVRIADKPEPVLNDMHFKDFMAAAALVADFLGDTPPTGGS